MATATAPSPEEIRLAVFQRYTRQRTGDDIQRWPESSYGARIEDTIAFDLLCDVREDLFGPYTGPDTRGRFDEIADEVLVPLVADLDARIMEAMATVFDRYVAETYRPG